MERRLIFPTVMFVAAGISFAFGTWQYLVARNAQASAAERMAFILTSIEQSSVPRAKKQELYATIAKDLPPAPGLFGIDFSGSFASQNGQDSCTNDGQRAICRALQYADADVATMTAICGRCNPR